MTGKFFFYEKKYEKKYMHLFLKLKWLKRAPNVTSKPVLILLSHVTLRVKVIGQAACKKCWINW